MGTEYLTIILIWCSSIRPTNSIFYPGEVDQCRKKKIECTRKLKDFTADDMIDKCLMKEQ